MPYVMKFVCKNATTSGQVKRGHHWEDGRHLRKREDNLSALKKVEGRPTVLMFVGMNGVGKVTTIPVKIAWRLKQKAISITCSRRYVPCRRHQQFVWGEQWGSPVVSGREGVEIHHLLYSMRLRRLKKKTWLFINRYSWSSSKQSELDEEVEVESYYLSWNWNRCWWNIVVLRCNNWPKYLVQAETIRWDVNITECLNEIRWDCKRPGNPLNSS